MNRERQIETITQRKVAQGVSAEEQYAALNAARDKRKKRRERNVKQMVAGAFQNRIFLVNS